MFILARDLAQGDVAEEVRAGLAKASLTASQTLDPEGYPTGDVRGIATGVVLRRLVARAIAQQFAEVILQAIALFQYAVSTRAGTDCVALLTPLLTDLDDDTTVSMELLE